MITILENLADRFENWFDNSLLPWGERFENWFDNSLLPWGERFENWFDYLTNKIDRK